jgi:hypothetical protein
LAFQTIQVSTVVAVLLRDLLDRHVQAVLLEQARFLGQGERREACPARDADRDLGFLRDGSSGQQQSSRKNAQRFLHDEFLWDG